MPILQQAFWATSFQKVPEAWLQHPPHPDDLQLRLHSQLGFSFGCVRTERSGSSSLVQFDSWKYLLGVDQELHP